MTYYHGGKKKIGKKIANTIYEICSEYDNIKGYCEPFCGMAGVFEYIPALFRDEPMSYKAGDINKSVIMMWNETKNGWKPPSTCSERKFYQLKGNGESSAEKGFLGHASAYRNIYFSTYDPGANLKYQAKRVPEIANTLKKVTFSHGNYKQFSRLKDYIIYCDPPYIINSYYPNEYHKYTGFDHEMFYDWVDDMSKHNLIFISERSKLPYKKVGTFNEDEKLYFI